MNNLINNTQDQRIEIEFATNLLQIFAEHFDEAYYVRIPAEKLGEELSLKDSAYELTKLEQLYLQNTMKDMTKPVKEVEIENGRLLVI
jgi:hypothetical protein